MYEFVARVLSNVQGIVWVGNVHRCMPPNEWIFFPFYVKLTIEYLNKMLKLMSSSVDFSDKFNKENIGVGNVDMESGSR